MEQITFGYSIILGILPWQTIEIHLALSTKRDYFFIFISIFDFTMKKSVCQLKEF